MDEQMLNEIVETVVEWFDDANEQEREQFQNCTKEQLIEYHHSLGRSIRNHFKLWNLKWRPKLIDGVDYSPNHPDALSMKIIRLVHERIQND